MIQDRLQPIPESREDFKKNELPICQQDIASISSVHGEEAAETVRFITQYVRMNGGINPRSVECIFPEGRQGLIDEEQLFKVVGNIAVWHQQL